ncbi:winged helix-turn-helix domain-containing protein [Streptomyces sp. NPDC045470]|uniref:helix-turn-helix domain-containing protein n=1 Tax=Streptomyces sp. NPDC045470 TaxID=3155469 RepID=UPI003405EE4F
MAGRSRPGPWHARMRTLIGRRFHKSFALSGITKMLRRPGWSHQVPARRPPDAIRMRWLAG